MAKNIANFIKEHNLDGVDIDWEYPGAPDLPWIGAERSPDEGANFLAFLVVLKNLLPGKTVSIAAPSSHWYLRQYPIQQMSKIVDYIVFMTYDLHGQWDANNMWSQDGCSSGTCLRSQVNLTETRQSLAMITKAGVPGKKIVLGVTSYGRSFEMAQPGCWGPGCTFTGSRLVSNAKKGRCTGTAGYVGDAEIAEIISGISGEGSVQARSSRVVASFVDTSSHSDILVYDNNQWVSYMGSTTKQTRATLYAAWGMGGTSDWASDLQKYYPVPGPLEDWPTFKDTINLGQSPMVKKTRSGSWTKIHCDSKFAGTDSLYSGADRWRGLEADAAWGDILAIWRTSDHPGDPDLMFTKSVTRTLGAGPDGTCGEIKTAYDHCDTYFMECPRVAEKDSGAAVEVVWNSLITVHRMYEIYFETLEAVGSTVTGQAADMGQTFAPIKQDPNKLWIDLLVDLVGFGAGSLAGAFTRFTLGSLVKGATKEAQEKAAEFVSDVTTKGYAMGKDTILNNKENWSPAKQALFGSYMAVAFIAWGNATRKTTKWLFSGEDAALDTLYSVISDGKLLDPNGAPGFATEDLQTNLGKVFYGFSIPALWRASQTYAFILDAGATCDKNKPVTDYKPVPKYLSDETMKATGACVDGYLYYLVHPEGSSTECVCSDSGLPNAGQCSTQTCRNSKFSAPVGIDGLSRFGGITKEDLVAGSVRTWLQNNKKNGVSTDEIIASTSNSLVSADVAGPGFVRLPVCSPELALQSWQNKSPGSTGNWPCDPPPGPNTCGVSSFTPEASDGSPFVLDCLRVAQDLEDGGGKSFEISGNGDQSALAWGQKGCRFGAEAVAPLENDNLYVGSQDIIDVIRSAVDQWTGGIYASETRMGGKGYMPCNGNTGKVGNVKWGIY